MIPESSQPEKRRLAQHGSPLAVLGVIPARLASTRLPRKVLRAVAGRTLLEWVYRAAIACPQLDRVVIATDSDEVDELCQGNIWPFLRTSPNLPSGTDRLHAVSEQVAAGIYVNIQGDEPLLTPTHIAALLRPFAAPHVDVTTLSVPCRPEDLGNPNAVKVVTAHDGRALYFSRAAIPFDRDGTLPPRRKHLGFYAYRQRALERFPHLAPSALEAAERLEQLRWLENGFAVYVEEVEQDTIGVDTEADLHAVESILLGRGTPRTAEIRSTSQITG